ncbi:hypothetical protein B0H13DRAFT_1936486 [Mycena leptocephala]|nr:hypothetical protein B0H13DRAFT_1936486 [Mycena leptocephala]
MAGIATYVLASSDRDRRYIEQSTRRNTYLIQDSEKISLGLGLQAHCGRIESFVIRGITSGSEGAKNVQRLHTGKRASEASSGSRGEMSRGTPSSCARIASYAETQRRLARCLGVGVYPPYYLGVLLSNALERFKVLRRTSVGVLLQSVHYKIFYLASPSDHDEALEEVWWTWNQRNNISAACECEDPVARVYKNVTKPQKQVLTYVLGEKKGITDKLNR